MNKVVHREGEPDMDIRDALGEQVIEFLTYTPLGPEGIQECVLKATFGASTHAGQSTISINAG
jgi:hypothetical protein